MPPEAQHAVSVLSLCERFGCLPGALFDEDEGLLQLLEIETLVREARGGE